MVSFAVHSGMAWIVVAFVVVAIASASARRRRALERMRSFEDDVLRSLSRAGGSPAAPPPPVAPPASRTPNLSCSSCGARAAAADVSAKGEVKCPYCGTTFGAYG